MSTLRCSVRIATDARPLVSIDAFPVEEGRVTFLFGESGIGKSMIAKALYGLLDPAELRVTVDGRPYREYLDQPRTRALQANSFFVFQEPSSHLNPLMRIREQLNEGSLREAHDEREILRGLWESVDDRAWERIIDVYPKPYRPSGGEKQRILLAMAFKKIGRFMERAAAAPAPSFFVFDEPTGSLDNNYRNLFLRMLLERYRACPFTVLLITHDYSIISEVYRTHRDLLGSVSFKELSRIEDDAVEVHEFSADEYLGWLRQAAPSGPPRQESGPVLEVKSSFRIFGRDLCIYRDASHTQPSDLLLRRGEMVYVKAPSGVGKTTLAKIVMGLYRAEQFEMRLDGVNADAATRPEMWPKKIWGVRAGMVFQHADEALDLEASVKETFDGLPLRKKLTPALLRAALGELFDEAIIDRLVAKKVKYLSGGQKQRLNLLRTIILNTNLIVLDEPLNALDFGSIKKVLALLEHRRARGSALLMISHNEEIFDHLVDQDHIFYLACVTPPKGPSESPRGS